MPRRNGNGNGNRVRPSRKTSNNGRVSRTPTKTLTRTFRTFENIYLNNSTGSGQNAYIYYSKYFNAKPSECSGFRNAQQTFEFWRLKNLRCKLQPGFNGFNQQYNTINLDAVAAMQCWVVADLSSNETVSGVSIMSYNNARCTTLSLNGLTTVCNTRSKLNDYSTTPHSLLPYSTWLDTQEDLSDSKVKYSGFQLFVKMPFTLSNDYRPMIQVIIEYDVEFKQPAWQNRPSTFELDIVGGILEVQPVSSSTDLRAYKCISYKIDGDGGDYRFERVDEEPGSLNFTQEEFWEVYYYQTSGSYFGGRPIRWTGPIPRKPLGWQPTV